MDSIIQSFYGYAYQFQHYPVMILDSQLGLDFFLSFNIPLRGKLCGTEA